MSIIVRRISLGKWKDYSETASKESLWDRMLHRKQVKYNAPADAITQCLKSTNNELSVWVVDSETQIDYALLAMALGTTTSDISTLHYILIDESELKEAGLKFEQSLDDADTAVPNLKCLHNDLKQIHYNELGKLQDIIVEHVKKNKQKRRTAGELKKLIEKAIDNGWIDYDMLDAKYLENLKKYFKTKQFVYKPDAKIDGMSNLNFKQ